MTVSEEIQEQVAKVGALLEAEIKRQVGQTWFGCWPLIVALAGIILGIALLVGGSH